MVNWEAQTSKGYIFTGLVDDSSWIDFKNTLYARRDEVGKVKSLKIFGTLGAATIDNDKDGYFLGNKILTALQGGATLELVGIGYWSKSDNVVRVKWYKTSTMELAVTEGRPLETSEFFLIRNN